MAALALDPWCFTQAEIRGTTLKAARVLYYEQAVRRHRNTRTATDKPKGPDTSAGVAEVFTDRETWVTQMRESFGDPPGKDWGADWDRLNAQGAGSKDHGNRGN